MVLAGLHLQETAFGGADLLVLVLGYYCVGPDLLQVTMGSFDSGTSAAMRSKLRQERNVAWDGTFDFSIKTLQDTPRRESSPNLVPR